MQLQLSLIACCLAYLAQCLALPMADWASVRVMSEQRKDFSGVDSRTPEKYFHESTFHPHYDGRFASKPLPYKEKLEHLRPLIQTYLSTMNDIGAETWIMHGTLIGWYWNRKTMPWDSDADVMMSEKSIEHLASYYNMTVHHYKIPGVAGGRDYMLEINPRWTNNSTEDKHNVIDGRWVDTSSGLFIDITTLRVNETARQEGIEGAMMCKDKHHYMYDDIFPLRESTFEDVPVKVPFAYAELIEAEYGAKAITKTTFEHHKFDPKTKEWVSLRCEERGDCTSRSSSSNNNNNDVDDDRRNKKIPQINNGARTFRQFDDTKAQPSNADQWLWHAYPNRRPPTSGGRRKQDP